MIITITGKNTKIEIGTILAFKDDPKIKATIISVKRRLVDRWNKLFVYDIEAETDWNFTHISHYYNRWRPLNKKEKEALVPTTQSVPVHLLTKYLTP